MEEDVKGEVGRDKQSEKGSKGGDTSVKCMERHMGGAGRRRGKESGNKASGNKLGSVMKKEMEMEVKSGRGNGGGK